KGLQVVAEQKVELGAVTLQSGVREISQIEGGKLRLVVQPLGRKASGFTRSLRRRAFGLCMCHGGQEEHRRQRKAGYDRMESSEHGATELQRGQAVCQPGLLHAQLRIPWH